MKQKKDIIEAVVVGGIHHNTLGVIRSLGDNKVVKFNVFLLLIDPDLRVNNYVAKSKYVKTINVGIVKSDDDIIEYLLDLSKDKKKRVVVCCSDGSSEKIIENYNILSKYYYLPSSSLKISDLSTKCFQFQIAKKIGFKIPSTALIEKGKSFSWNLFPCITKPEKSTIGGGKSDIYISNNSDELSKAIDNTISKSIFVQEFIKKKMEYQLIGCSLNHGERVIIPGYTKILRQPFNTNTGYLEYIPIDKLSYDYQAILNFMRTIGYDGLFSLEFLRSDNDDDYFLEINLRNDGNGFCVKSAGINLPLIWCYYQVYNEIPPVRLSFTKPIRFMPEFPDFKIGVKKVGLFKWIYQFLSAKSHAVLNAKDIKPFFCKLSSFFFHKN